MIYLDYNATAPMRPEALVALETLSRDGRNATSIHGPGRRARVAIDAARESLRVLVGAPKTDVVFTGSGTEADLLGLIGLARRERTARGATRILVSAIEHPAVIEAAKSLVHEGFRVEEIPFARPTGVDFQAFEAMLEADVAVVAVMLANNETGLLLPVQEIAGLCSRYAIPVHCDAVQAAGKMPINFLQLGVSTMAIAGHKFGGPRGIGALLTLKCAGLPPLWSGGGQEEGMRSGSHAVGLAVAMGEAAKQASSWLESGGPAKVGGLRDSLEAGLEGIDGVQALCRGLERLTNTALVGFQGWSGKALVEAFDEVGVLVSAGAACHSGDSHASATARLFSTNQNVGVVRLSLGPQITQENISEVIRRVRTVVGAGVAG